MNAIRQTFINHEEVYSMQYKSYHPDQLRIHLDSNDCQDCFCSVRKICCKPCNSVVGNFLLLLAIDAVADAITT